VTAGESLCPNLEQEIQTLHRGEKRGNLHHNKNPARGNISSIISLRKIAGAPGEKNLKIPTTGAQGIKTLAKNNFNCLNLN
jgi:hypothetical protein